MAHKDTKGKLKLNLVPIKPLKAIARVREFGNAKYPSKDGFSYLTEVRSNDLVEAAWRHLLLHMEGELIDKESKEMHLAHAATSLMMAMDIKYYQIEKSRQTLWEHQAYHKLYQTRGE